MRSRTLKIMVIMLAGLSTTAAARPSLGEFQITGVVSQGEGIRSIARAEALLAGQLPGNGQTSAHSLVVNFDDPQNPGGGYHFEHKTPFLIDTAAKDANFAIHATATVHIPSAGDWTFGVNSDDGFALKVGGFSFSHAGLRAAKDSLRTFTFDQPGIYPLDLTFFQHRGQAELELFASAGRFSRFHKAGANFQLVGDTTNGGLSLVNPPTALPAVGSAPPPVPEPAALGLLAPMALSLLRRRRAA